MTSVTLNAITSAASTDSNFDASDVWSTASTGGNFQNITAGVNNGKLDSANYSNSGFLSQHIGQGQINSAHVSNSAVNSTKLTDSTIGQPHITYKSSDSGVRAVQVGVLAPANGLYCARVTQTVSWQDASPNTDTQSVAFSDAIGGDPSYTAAPTPGDFVFQGNFSGPSGNAFSVINSTGATFMFHFTNGFTATHATDIFTVHMEFWGPV
jgi:hypothetical protein